MLMLFTVVVVVEDESGSAVVVVVPGICELGLLVSVPPLMDLEVEKADEKGEIN